MFTKNVYGGKHVRGLAPRLYSCKRGKTRMNPMHPAKRIDRYMKRKIERTHKKIEKLSRQSGAPPMAFMTIMGDTVRLTGANGLCSKLVDLKADDLHSLSTPAFADTSTNGATVDLRNIDLAIDFQMVNTLVCRQAFVMLTKKDQGKRQLYREEDKPLYWPEGIPFASHSTKGLDGKGRLLSGQMIREVLRSFQNHCLQKIRDGDSPINFVSTTDLEKLKRQAYGQSALTDEVPNSSVTEELPVKTADLMRQAHGQSSLTDEATNSSVTDELPVTATADRTGASGGICVNGHMSSSLSIQVTEASIQETEEDCANENANIRANFEEDDSPLIHLMRTTDDADGIRALLVERWPPSREELVCLTLWLETQPPINLDCVPAKQVQRSYKGPRDFLPSKGHADVWECLHDFATIARLHVAVFALLHKHHYISQYGQLNTSLDEVKKAFRNRGRAVSVDELLDEEICMGLQEVETGPATFLFIAGTLMSTVCLLNKRGTLLVVPACCCEETEEPIMFYRDEQDRYFVLSRCQLWKGRKSQLSRKATSTSTNKQIKRLPVLPGSDGPIINCYGYTVTGREIENVRHAEWLTDSIVYVSIRYEKEKLNVSDALVLHSDFGRTLLVPRRSWDSWSTLPLTACNIAEADRLVQRHDLDQFRVVLAPICNNAHWFLVAFFPKEAELQILCSMGRKYKQAEMTLKSFFGRKALRQSLLRIKYPLVPQQDNGSDCGVFVIEYGIELLKTKNVTWLSMKLGGRQRVLRILEEIMEK